MASSRSSSSSSSSFSSRTAKKNAILDGVQEVLVRVSRAEPVEDVLKEVSKALKLSFSSLRNAYYDDPRREDLGHRNRKLFDHEEQKVVGLINGFCDNRIPLSKPELGVWAGKLFDTTFTEKWITNFVKRHVKAIKLTKAKIIAQRRISPNTLEDVKGFLTIMDNKWTLLPTEADMIANYDESLIALKGTDCDAITTRHPIAKCRLGQRYRTLGSVLPFISADGNVIMTVFIFPIQHIDTEVEKSLKITVDTTHQVGNEDWFTFYAFSRTGYVNSVLFRNIIDCLIKVRAYKGQTRRLVLFGDNLAAHRDAETIAKAYKADIHLVFFPPNCSHFIQPLDSYPFARFKQVLQILQRKQYFGSFFNDSLQSFTDLRLAGDAFREAFTKETIIAAFRDTGLFPFNKQLILTRAQSNVGIHIPTSNFWMEDVREIVGEVIERKKLEYAEESKRIQRQKADVQGDICYQMTPVDCEDPSAKIRGPVQKKPRRSRKRTRKEANDDKARDEEVPDGESEEQLAPKRKKPRLSNKKNRKN